MLIDASQLDRDALLELRAVIDRLLADQVSLEMGAPQREPQQASHTEEMDFEPLVLLKR